MHESTVVLDQQPDQSHRLEAEFTPEMNERALATGHFITQAAEASLDQYVAKQHARSEELLAEGDTGRSFVARQMGDLAKEAGIDGQRGYGHINTGREAARAEEKANPDGPISLTDMTKVGKFLEQADSYKRGREMGLSHENAQAKVDRLEDEGFFDKYKTGTGRS